MSATTRPLIANAEWRNGSPALAQVVRKLCRWATYSYERDLVYTPADPKIVVPGAPGAGWSGTPTHLCTAGTDGEVIVGVFPIPDALSPARSLDLRFLTDGGTGWLRFRIGSTGVATDVAIGAGQVWGHKTLFLPSGADSITVSLVPSSGTIMLASLTGWFGNGDFGSPFGRPDVTLLGSFSPISQTLPSDAFSTVILQRLSFNANAYTNAHARAVVAKYFWAWWSLGAGGDVGIYRVNIAPGINSLRVNLLGKSKGPAGAYGCTVTVRDTGGSLLGTGAVSWAPDNTAGADYSWQGVSVALSGSSLGSRLLDVRLTTTQPVDGAAGVYVASASVWEEDGTAASLALPGGQTVPGAFPSLPDPSSRDPILAATLSDLVKAQVYLFAKRGRQLVCDCRHTGVGWATDGYNYDTLDASDIAVFGGVHFLRVQGRRMVKSTPDRSAAVTRRGMLGTAIATSAVSTVQYLSTNVTYPYGGQTPAPTWHQDAVHWIDISGTGLAYPGASSEEQVLGRNRGDPTHLTLVPADIYDLGAVYWEA